MASIERTAYSNIKRNPVVKELDALYTPSDDELGFARALARKARHRFAPVAVEIVSAPWLFSSSWDIPPVILQNVHAMSGTHTDVSPIYAEMRTLYRHHQANLCFTFQNPLGADLRCVVRHTPVGRNGNSAPMRSNRECFS